MPTAIDGAVFIRWERIEIAPNPISGHYDVHVETTVNVAGTLVKTFTQYTSITSADIVDGLDNALEDKRVLYVTP